LPQKTHLSPLQDGHPQKIKKIQIRGVTLVTLSRFTPHQFIPYSSQLGERTSPYNFTFYFLLFIHRSRDTTPPPSCHHSTTVETYLHRGRDPMRPPSRKDSKMLRKLLMADKKNIFRHEIFFKIAVHCKKFRKYPSLWKSLVLGWLKPSIFCTKKETAQLLLLGSPFTSFFIKMPLLLTLEYDQSYYCSILVTTNLYPLPWTLRISTFGSFFKCLRSFVI